MLMVFSIACFLVFCAALVYFVCWWFSFDRGPFVKIVAFKIDPDKRPIPELQNEDDFLVEVTLSNCGIQRTYRYSEKFNMWVDRSGRTISYSRVLTLKHLFNYAQKKAQKARKHAVDRFQAAREVWGNVWGDEP